MPARKGSASDAWTAIGTMATAAEDMLGLGSFSSLASGAQVKRWLEG